MRGLLVVLAVVFSIAGGVAGRTVMRGAAPTSWPVEPRERSAYELEVVTISEFSANLAPVFSCSGEERERWIKFILARGEAIGRQKRDVIDAKRRELGLAPDVGLVISGGVAWVVTSSR